MAQAIDTYTIKDDQGKNELTLNRSNNPMSGAELKNCFFSSGLKEKVAIEYNNILVPTST